MTGKRKGYTGMGMVDYVSGQLFFAGGTGHLTATRYCASLARILKQTDQPIVLIHDGASCPTAAQTRRFVAEHADCLSVYRLSGYSPNYHTIEHLWRHIKRDESDNRYFPTFREVDIESSSDTGDADD
jgi:transposase